MPGQAGLSRRRSDHLYAEWLAGQGFALDFGLSRRYDKFSRRLRHKDVGVGCLRRTL